MRLPDKAPRRLISWHSERSNSADHDFTKRTILVKAVKFTLVTTTALTVIALIWAIIGHRSIDRFTLSYSTVEVGKQQPAMSKPRLQGVDDNQQPYTVTADQAIQQDADHVDLTKLQADISLKDGSWVNIIANSGAMNVTGKTIDLKGNVQMYHDSGVTFITEAAMVDFGNGMITGDSQINGQGGTGTLRADSFKIWSKQKVLRFNGHVKVVING